MTIDNERIKIIDKVVKLLALAEGTDHSEEQETAKRMAAELMAKHNIRLGEATKRDASFSKKTSAQSTKIPQKFDVLLANAIAKFNGVAMLTRYGEYGPRKAEFIFVGKDSDIEATEYMFDIVKQQRKVAHKKYEGEFKKYGIEETEQEWRAWHNGFTRGVQVKLDELTAMTHTKVEEKGLVPVDAAKQALDWYKKSNKTGTNKRGMGQGSLDGYNAGKDVSIHKGIGNTNSGKMIG